MNWLQGLLVVAKGLCVYKCAQRRTTYVCLIKKSRKTRCHLSLIYVGFSPYSKLNTHIIPTVMKQLSKTMISSDEKTLPATSFCLEPLMLPNSSLIVQPGNDTTNEPPISAQSTNTFTQTHITTTTERNIL